MSKFIKGMDLSTLLELERCGAKYYEDGKEKDILDIMKEHDVDTIRIRLWNDPNQRMVSLTVRVTMTLLRLLLSEKKGHRCRLWSAFEFPLQ